MLLDYVLGVNVRLAFLEPWPGWRAVYYLFCFSCLGVISWRPGLTLLVSTVESLITLAALLLGFGVRVMAAPALALETGRGIVSGEEILNFLIAGGAAWLGWIRGSQALHDQFRRR